MVMSFLVPRNYSVDGKYFRFHQKYGVQRTSILKFIFGFLVIIFMWDSPLNVEILPIVVIYCAYIAWLIFQICSILSATTKKHSKIPRHPLDSLVGFLIYPFEYLETRKSIFTVQSKKLRWSWGAFWLPEWWYFKNEILGAGYLSLLFLFIYLALFVALGMEGFLFMLFIRVISGLYGPKVYFAKHGQWA
ncbi:MAG: hypothetical protein ACFFGZ_17655 [Candidatus Thorarchaeota archaeon]